MTDVHTSIALLLELGTVLVLLSAAGSLTRRFGVSPIPLYLLCGLAMGEGGFAPLPAAGDFVEIGASIGVVLLLLTLGLEFSVEEFPVTLRKHVPSGVVDLLLNAPPGAVAGWLLGLDATGIVALAGVTWVSSSTIVSRLLDDSHRLGNRETPAVLSILLLEDFAMAVYLPILAVLASGGTLLQALASVAVALGVLALALVISRHWGHRVGQVVDDRDTEQLLLRIVGLALVVAAVAELAGTSAAVGAFLVGLALTGPLAERVRSVISPLRDLFAAAFFLAIGFSIPPASLPPLLPVAFGLAVVTALTKMGTGWFAAARGGSGRRGRLRAGSVLVVRGEFSVIIVGLVAAQGGVLGPLATGYVLILAVAGPLLTWWLGRPDATLT
ncbi:cation:proton antiporter [Saccharopolyspora sp. NPDC049426]|uniref:cation:proton antiporter n=1 Tax=Saccharopolyspora sp. NPDC049426 TaxID=3155652 RepID=UPI0034413175